MIKIKLQTNTFKEYIEFLTMLNIYKKNYFILHESKRTYSSKNGMLRFYIDIAKIDHKNYTINNKNEIINIKTGHKLQEQIINLTPEIKTGKLKRGRKPKEQKI